METPLNEELLETRLAELEKSRAWSPRVISKLEAMIRGSAPFSLYRINPVKFGVDRGISEHESIDLFLHAAKQGLFRMEWRLI